MAKKRTYSVKRVRRNYTYDINQIAEKFDITRDTVFRWIRDEGLRRIQSGRKYRVHGSDLIAFIEKRNAKHKKPCKAHEIYCTKCKLPRTSQKSSIKFKKKPNKTIHVSGKCVCCNTRINKFVKAKEWSKNHPLYPAPKVSTKTHSGAQDSHLECQHKKGEQLCLDITL
jgi:excisionase family DNA binding protein